MPQTAPRIRLSYSNVDGATVTKKFYVNGPDKETVDRRLNTAELPSDTQAMLCAYGANAAANAQIQGFAKTAVEAATIWDDFVTSLRDGSWTPGRQGGEAGPSELALAIERYEQHTPDAVKHSRTEIVAALDALSPAQKRQLHSDPMIARHLRDIRVEKAREAEKATRGKPSVLGGLFGSRSQTVSEAAE